MLRYFLIALFAVLFVNVNAQENDSLFVVRKGNSWAIKYMLKANENMNMIAYRFYLSEGALLYANDPDNVKKIGTGSVIFIPVTKDNYFSTKQTFDARQPLYYRVGMKDDIGLVSMYSGVTKDEMRQWNNLKGNTLALDKVLFVGWVKMMAFDTSDMTTAAAYPPVKKATQGEPPRVHVPGGLDSLYNLQTSNGLNVLNEKGTAVFFEKGMKSNIYQAFHNTSRRGTIIKVFNPGTGKTIYVKVIGTIPETKQYANCIIGISESAKEALGVVDDKAWCELSYSPN